MELKAPSEETTQTSEETAFTCTPPNALMDIDHDIVVAVLKAFNLMEDMGRSKKFIRYHQLWEKSYIVKGILSF